MIIFLTLSFLALAIISWAMKGEAASNEMSTFIVSGFIFGFFLLSTSIAVVAALAGIGGGVIFTPIMLAFTPIHSLIIRAAGLLLCMTSGLSSTGPYFKRGLGNLHTCIFLSIALSVGFFTGAVSAIAVSELLGEGGGGWG